MKKIIILFVVLGLVGCETTPAPQSQEKVVTGIFTEDVYWYSDTVYELSGKVVIEEGATLFIEPGTVIKSRDGQGSLSTALIIAQGGKIDAQGTSESPIIFTSIYDTGNNLDESDQGLWGGVVVLGYAPISSDQDIIPAHIEGIPANLSYGAYGGNDPEDNSGILKYVSIRHAGTLLGNGNELNGLTLGGVGSGTVIDNIEVVGNLDDGIEFFGGTVNASNLVVLAQGDDAFDLDQAYGGTITNFIAIEGVDSDHALEIDGPEGSYEDSFVMQNGLFISDDGVECHFRDGASGVVSFKGQANVSADPGTSVGVTILEDITVPDFSWTYSHSIGKL